MKTTKDDIRRDMALVNEMTAVKFSGAECNGHIDYADCFVYYDPNGFSVTERRKPGQADEEAGFYREKRT